MTTIYPPLSGIEAVRMGTLQPHIQDAFLLLRFVSLLQFNQRLYLTNATRTFDEQNLVYAKGRTAPGPIVTQARPGQSWHNFGLAFDCCLTSDTGILDWSMPKQIGELAERFGIEWGGNWTSFQDENHFQVLHLMTLADANKAWPDGWHVTAAS